MWQAYYVTGMTSAERRAILLAKSAHSKQLYGGKSYIDAHLQKVVDIVKSVTNDQDTIVTAWLHDILEDTSTTESYLQKNFGNLVAEQVESLTRKGTEKQYLERLRIATDNAKLVKLADIIVNLNNISTNKEPKRYFRQKVKELGAILNQQLPIFDRTPNPSQYRDS